MRHRHTLVCALIGGALFATDVLAQQLHTTPNAPSAQNDVEIIPSRPITQANARAADPKTGPLTRLQDTLRDLVYYAQSNARVASDRMVAVDVLATRAGDVDRLGAGLAALGFEVTGRGGLMISGRIPITALEAAAELPGLRFAMASHRLLHRGGTSVAAPLLSARTPAAAVAARVGAVEGEASVALRADDARANFGVDGSGECIGVLSDSYDNLGGAAAGVGSGDLPAGINVLDDFGGGGSDEGRAMMELAFDVAPGVNFAFHTAFNGFSDFSGGIVQLHNAGCGIIVDDVAYAGEPFFQDGVIAQAVDYVVGQGASYFSSAGNSANASYEADFVDSGAAGFFGGALHDFDPGPGVDPFQDIVMFPGEVLRFAFQYDEPSVLAGVENSEFPALYGGVAGQAPTSDYDLFLFDAPSTAAGVLDVSFDVNTTTGVPFEFIEYQNTTGGMQTVYLAIEQFSGDDRRLKYINFGGFGVLITTAEYNAGGSSTTFGHSNADGAFATGAAPWFNTDEWNAFVAANPAIFGAAAVEPFTAYGGLDIRLDLDGNRLSTPVDRMKPDATASDADNNTFFGFDTGADADALPNFFGTSAAAPNAAGVAALMVEAAGGTLTPAQVYSTLESTAADILPAPGVPPGFNLGATPGFDDQTGHGLIRADDAVAAVALPPADPCDTSRLLSFGDFDADGNAPNVGEFVDIDNAEPGPIDLSTCTFIALNVFTEKVTYAATTAGTVDGGDTYRLASQNGDQQIPPATLPDGPGAFALIEGPVAVGADVLDVLGSVVAAVVYINENLVVGSVGGGGGARTRSAEEVLPEAFLQARAAAAEAVVDPTVSVVPNPVGSTLHVGFGAQQAADVRASIFDALGREVAVLADRTVDAGRHEVTFDTAALPTGVYVVRVVVAGEARMARVTVVR